MRPKTLPFTKSLVYARRSRVWELRTNKEEECVLTPSPPPATQYTKHTPCPSPLVRGEVQQSSSFRNIVSEWEQSQDAFSCLNLPCRTIRTGLSKLSNMYYMDMEKVPFQTHLGFMKLYIFIVWNQSINEISASWVARLLELLLFGCLVIFKRLRELWRGEWSGRSEELFTREELRAGAILLHCEYCLISMKTFLRENPSLSRLRITGKAHAGGI